MVPKSERERIKAEKLAEEARKKQLAEVQSHEVTRPEPQQPQIVVQNTILYIIGSAISESNISDVAEPFLCLYVFLNQSILHCSQLLTNSSFTDIYRPTTMNFRAYPRGRAIIQE